MVNLFSINLTTETQRHHRVSQRKSFSDRLLGNFKWHKTSGMPLAARRKANARIDHEHEKIIKVEARGEQFDRARKIFKTSVRRPSTIQPQVSRESLTNSRGGYGYQRVSLLRGRMQPTGPC